MSKICSSGVINGIKYLIGPIDGHHNDIPVSITTDDGREVSIIASSFSAAEQWVSKQINKYRLSRYKE